MEMVIGATDFLESVVKRALDMNFLIIKLYSLAVVVATRTSKMYILFFNEEKIYYKIVTSIVGKSKYS